MRVAWSPQELRRLDGCTNLPILEHLSHTTDAQVSRLPHPQIPAPPTPSTRALFDQLRPRTVG